MSVPVSKHKVYMFKNDYNAMCTEVYRHQHIQTGGNLFGLWTTSGSAVIHVVLGPGQRCRRTETSFHQDLEYMGRVGRFVNDNYMLCHIGEWHSNHNLSLDKPSAGDESTIRRNFPQGMSKFLVIIANIRNGDTIKLSPYFFTHGGERYEKAEYKVVDSDSPFSTDDEILEQINLGTERKKYQRRSKSTLEETASHSGASSRNTGNRRNMVSNGNTNPTRFQANQSSLLCLSTPPSKPTPNPSSPDSLVNPTTSTSNPNLNTPDSLVNQNKSKSQANPSSSFTQVNVSIPSLTANPSLVNPHLPNSSASPSTPDAQVNPSTSDSGVNLSTPESHANPRGSTPDDHQEQMDTEDNDLYPPRNYEDSSNPENDTSSSQPGTSTGSQADPDKSTNNDEETPSEREIILKKINDQLKYWFGSQSDSMFKFETSKNSPGAIEISFKHNNKYWMVRFPNDFPTIPAKLFYSSWQASVRSNECTTFDLVKPLNNEVNILLAIKNVCSACNVCKRFTEESLSQPDLISRSIKKLVVSLNKLVNELTTTFSDVTALNVNHPLDSSHAEITFKHSDRHWIINLPAQFPEVSAKMFYLFNEGSSQKHDALFSGKYTHGPQDLVTSKLIIKAIRFNCSCTKCKDMQKQYR